MSYTPTEWTTGDVITAEKLNNAEEGIAAANAAYPGIDVLLKMEFDMTEYYEPIVTVTILKGDRVTDGQRALAGEYVRLDCYGILVNGPKTETMYASTLAWDVIDVSGDPVWKWQMNLGANASDDENPVIINCECSWDGDGVHVQAWPN